jgi:DNA polymerase III delta prime subunit
MQEIDKQIHSDIYLKLNAFIDSNRVPNILFYGPSGSGKSTILRQFLNQLYSPITDARKRRELTMYVDCKYGKGIKFIRGELQFFARSNISTQGTFKSIVLTHADKLTFDAQSALRRCIELNSKTTRFFILIDNPSLILQPILSRFSRMYVPLPLINNKVENLHSYFKRSAFEQKENFFLSRNKYLRSRIKSQNTKEANTSFIELTEDLIEKAYSTDEVVACFENDKSKTDFHYLYAILCKEIRSEKLLMLSALQLLFRSDSDLEMSAFIT